MSTNRVTVGGPAGIVRWGYHCAASLGRWTVTQDESGHQLTAEVVSADAFKVSQRPLTFVVDRQAGAAWRWPVVSLQVTGQTLTASLGPME